MFTDGMPIIFWVGAALWGGFYLGRLLEKWGLPALIGHMFLGILLGPSVLNILESEQLHDLGFIIDFGLGLVAFLIGTELSLSLFKRMGYKLSIIVFCETLITFFLVYFGMTLFDASQPLALILAAIASASAPAGTVAVIQSYQARGTLTKVLYAVVGIDDAVAALLFGLATAFALIIFNPVGLENGDSLRLILAPFKEIFLSIILGVGLGIAFRYSARYKRHPSQLLIFIVAAITAAAGIATAWHLSLILCTMTLGVWLANFSGEHHLDRVRTLVNNLLPTIFILFFVLAGAHLDIFSLASLGVFGAVYIVTRTVGKWAGGYIGAQWAGMPPNVSHHLGSAILCQAGLAVSLALLVADQLKSLSLATGNPEPAETGTMIFSIVTATTVIFEIFGPLMTRRALVKAGDIKLKGN